MKSWKTVCGEVMRTLAIGVVAALLGILLAGCDGTGSEVEVKDGQGLKYLPNGSVYCDVPSPTGDVVNRSTGKTAREDVMEEVRGGTFVGFVVVDEWENPAASIDAACSATFGSCSDAAHDRASPSGEKHCLVLGGASVGACSGCCTDLRGTTHCKLASFGKLDESAGKPRAEAACSTDGVFLGWACST
jgi:hypothetical protein